MSLISCRLCSFACCEFKCLYEENGEKSEVYHVAVKYFNSSLLDAEMELTKRVICLECWQHISDFYSFQQWVLNAQTLQDDFKFIIHDEEADLKGDRKDNIVFPLSKCNKCEEIFQSHAELNGHFQAFHPVSCPDGNVDTKVNSVESEDAKLIPAEPQYRDENYYKCETCGASFSQYGNLRRHMRKKHKLEPLHKWICRYCNKMFKNRSNLERHKNAIHNFKYDDNDDDDENYNMCNESGILNHNQNFKQTCYNTRFSKKEISNDKTIESNLSPQSSIKETNPNEQIHMPVLDIIDIKDEISADEEDKEISNKVVKTGYSDEISSDTDDDGDFLSKWKGYFECPRCKKHAQNYSELSEHFVLEHPEELCYVICCNSTLYDQQSIEEHGQYHENPNAFECEDCNKCFKNKRGLRSHKLQVHSDNRSAYHLHLCYCKRAKELNAEGHQMEYDTFVCCPRKKKILEDDALIARWKKVLICEICKANFVYYSLMRAHVYHEHPGEKCYISCCHRKMSRISDALQHIRFHLDPHAYRCKVCNLDFSGKNSLVKHMRNTHTDLLPKHRWACDQCDKTFEIRQILTRHKNVYHSKQA